MTWIKNLINKIWPKKEVCENPDIKYPDLLTTSDILNEYFFSYQSHKSDGTFYGYGVFVKYEHEHWQEVFKREIQKLKSADDRIKHDVQILSVTKL